MEASYGSCDVCNKGKFELKEKKEVAGSQYNMLICNKCHRQVARRAG
jgi:hypothetical protein